MSDHFKACSESQRLCDSLSDGLQKDLSSLECDRTNRQCILRFDGKSVALIRHRKRLHQIEVFCLLEPSQVLAIYKVDLRRRAETWGSQYKSRFFVHEYDDLNNICDILRQSLEHIGSYKGNEG